jgi:hypothetical protein
MTTHPEALRLADLLSRQDLLSVKNLTTEVQNAAAELRRQHAENTELRMALKNTTVHLIAAHSLLSRGGKKAAASDTIFQIMLADYEKSFELGRATLARG